LKEFLAAGDEKSAQDFGLKGKITQESTGKIVHESCKWRQTRITWKNKNFKKQHTEI